MHQLNKMSCLLIKSLFSRKSWNYVALFSLYLFSSCVHAVSSIQISIGKIDSPVGEFKQADFHVDLKGKKPKLILTADIKPKNEPDFITFKLECGTLFSEQKGYVDCFDGQLISSVINAPFSMHIAQLNHELAFDVLFNGANFSDQAGLHAGDNLIGDFQLTAKKAGNLWQWDGKISWDKGEVFWQPFYFGDADNTFTAQGTIDSAFIKVTNASLIVNKVGEIKASASINAKSKVLEDVKVSAQDVDFNGLYMLLLKPKLEKSVFGNLVVSGKANWQFEMHQLQPTSFQLNMIDANIEDQNGKFAFSHMNAHIPWDYDVPKNISLDYKNGYLLNIPLGETRLNAELNRYSLTSPELVLPVLDGALSFKDVSAAWLGENWFWHLRMDLIPIDLNQFSAALGWPSMDGQISGQIPLVTYANKQLNMDGAMTFNMFNGTVGMNHLRIDDPLGVVPKMYADLTVRNIDLGELTKTYSFGAIQGKLDGDIKALELENWKPIKFDASLQTNDKEQVKKISQRAVENIAALGGEGTAAALQRTFLRFFDEFNYDKIGISCKLRRDICEMGGVESTPQGYIIVKGSGIPAVNVNGYTKYVSLIDLLGRIKRITDSNSKVVVE
jgi:hypothetical protein